MHFKPVIIYTGEKQNARVKCKKRESFVKIHGFTDGCGTARTIGDDMAYVFRIPRLTLLAPEIIHGILSGQLDQISVEKCRQPFPVLRDEQKKFSGIE